jgi:hypothetical protein
MLKKDELAQPGSCINKSADDEPVFVLCARDPAAAHAVRDWVERRRILGMTRGDNREREEAKLQEALQCAAQMEQWSCA